MLAQPLSQTIAAANTAIHCMDHFVPDTLERFVFIFPIQVSEPRDQRATRKNNAILLLATLDR